MRAGLLRVLVVLLLLPCLASGQTLPGSPFQGGGGGASTAFSDATFSIFDDATPTKIAVFQASTIAGATTRTFTFPNLDGTLAMVNANQSWTGQQSFTQNVSSNVYLTATNCSSAAAPAVCGGAAAGSVVIAAAGTTVTVNTNAVTANSQIFIQEDSSLGTKLSVTCNTVTTRAYYVTTRTAATSFVITASAAPVTNPACLSYLIIN